MMINKGIFSPFQGNKYGYQRLYSKLYAKLYFCLMRSVIFYISAACMLLLTACSTTRKAGQAARLTSLKMLSEFEVPYNTKFENTVTGGLSGIDYNAAKDEYYLICDDRGNYNHPRFYTATIHIRDYRIDTVLFKSVTFLKDRAGNYYPSSREDPYHTPDPEAMRYNALKHTFVWTSEGERIVSPAKTILENPAITETDPDGNYLDTFALPSQFIMKATENGPRQNGVFEGIAFDKNYQYAFVSTEEPLYEDGPRAGTGDSSGTIRIIKYDMQTKRPVAQYAYRVEPVAYPPVTPSAYKINGISDILWTGKDRLLVIERSYSTGRIPCTIRLFEADLSKATDISSLGSLKDHPKVKMASKKLLLNMDELGILTDNIEGITFGPTLPNGKRSLVLVVDNNFNPLEKMQFFLFEVN